MAVFLAVSAGVLAIVAATGCAWLMSSNTTYGGARTQVTSLLPRDNPLALALSTPTDQERVGSILNAVVNAHSGVPANTPCSEAPVAGCRYTIPLQTTRVHVGKTENAGCSLLEVIVEARAGAGRRISPPVYRPMTCPAAIPSGRPTE